MSNTTGVLCQKGTTYLSSAPVLTPVFVGIRAVFGGIRHCFNPSFWWYSSPVLTPDFGGIRHLF
jgi:hypothetical protein